jgi:hypothetical protein
VASKSSCRGFSTTIRSAWNITSKVPRENCNLSGLCQVGQDPDLAAFLQIISLPPTAAASAAASAAAAAAEKNEKLRNRPGPTPFNVKALRMVGGSEVDEADTGGDESSDTIAPRIVAPGSVRPELVDSSRGGGTAGRAPTVPRASEPRGTVWLGSADFPAP